MVFMRRFLEALGSLFLGAIISVGQLTSAPIEVASLARRKNQSVANVRISGRRTSKMLSSGLRGRIGYCHHCSERITPSPREGRAGRGLGWARLCGFGVVWQPLSLTLSP